MTEPHANKQLEILRFIYDTVEERAFPPTVREICSAVDLSSTSTVHGHLARLEKKGYILKDATKQHTKFYKRSDIRTELT